MTMKPVAGTTKGRRGQPPKKPPADAARRIQALAADGFSVRGVAAGLNVSQDTLRKWFDADPSLRDAFELGREQERHVLHNCLYRAATENGNMTAAMFLLKSRHGYKEGDPGEGGSRVTVNFSLPGALPLKDFEVIGNEQDN